MLYEEALNVSITLLNRLPLTLTLGTLLKPQILYKKGKNPTKMLKTIQQIDIFDEPW